MMRRAWLGQLHVNNLAHLFLGVMGYADGADFALHSNLGMVLMKFYIGHGVSFPFFRNKRDSPGLIAYLRH